MICFYHFQKCILQYKPPELEGSFEFTHIYIIINFTGLRMTFLPHITYGESGIPMYYVNCALNRNRLGVIWDSNK